MTTNQVDRKWQTAAPVAEATITLPLAEPQPIRWNDGDTQITVQATYVRWCFVTGGLPGDYRRNGYAKVTAYSEDSENQSWPAGSQPDWVPVPPPLSWLAVVDAAERAVLSVRVDEAVQ